MPLPPWLLTLPKTARTFFPFAQAAVARGISANSIIEAFKLEDKGIRRKLGLEVVRRVRDVERKTNATKYTRKDRRHDPSLIPTAMTDLLHDFSHKVRYTGVTALGEPFEGFLTVSTDDRITPTEALTTALEFFDDGPEEYGIAEIGEFFYEGVKKHPRLG